MATGAVSETEELVFIRKVIDEGSIATTQILVVLVAFTLNMLDGFDVTAMAFTVHGIGQELQIAPNHLGIVFSVALAGMMIGAMFLAPVADMLGRRKMIIACVTMIGLSMCATGFATSLWELIVYRAITGLGVGGMLASLAAISAEYTPAKYRSLAVMSITAGYPLGATLGSFIAAPLIPAYGWQSVFFAGGLATLSMLILVYFFIPESLQFMLAKRNENSLAQINLVLGRLKRPALTELPLIDMQAERARPNVLSLLTQGRRVRTLTLWASFLFCFMSLYFMMSWIPKLLINAGFSESFGVYAAAAFNGGAVIGIVTLGWISARVSLSKLIGTYLTSSAVVMIIFAYASGVNHLFPYLIAIGFLLQGGFVGLYAVAAKIYPTELRSTGVGWAIGLGRFGAVLGPYFGGLFIAQGVSMEVNFIIFAVPLILSGLIAYTLAVR